MGVHRDEAPLGEGIDAVSGWPTSLRSRLTLWYSVLLGLPLIAFAVACYFVFSRALEDRTDRFIVDALTAFSRELVAERRSAMSVADAMRNTVDEVHFRDLHIAILDTAGRVVAVGVGNGESSAGRSREGILTGLRGHDLTKPLAATLVNAGGDYRVHARPFTAGGQQFRVTGIYSLDDTELVLARIREMFLIAIPLLVLCAATGGYVLAKRSLAPVASMATHAAEIGATNLHERLPVSGGDELVGLARIVNGLLDRLQHSFEQQRRFVADASHELRTPTAIVRTEADVTLSRAHRDEPEYRASIAVIQEAAQRLTRIVDDLFLLARSDSGHVIVRRDALYLEELVHDATRAVRSVADRRAVHIETLQLIEAPFSGDPDLLGRLLLNLIDNAIKHSPDGATVGVTMARRSDRYEISVVDAGAGVPPEAHARIFERFFRVDAARSRTGNSATSGAGLGLAIARRIAEMHAGHLELAESRPGRTEFRLTLPIGQTPTGTTRLE